MGYLYSNSYYLINFVDAQLLDPITIDLYDSQFIPDTDSTGQVEVAVDYTLNDPSLYGSKINGIMETYSPDGTLLKTSSYPDGFSITDSGIIVFSTSLNDESIPSATVNITLTDFEKTETLSNTLSTTIPFNDEEGQERLINKISRTTNDQDLSDAINQMNNRDISVEEKRVERIFSNSQTDLNITSATTYFDDDYFHIVGEVLNTASEEKEFVKVTATIYDEDNIVIGTAIAFTSPSTISSQESAPFEFMIGENDVSNLDAIKSYKIIASDS